MMAFVSRRRLVRFFSTDLVSVLVLGAATIYLRQPLIGVGALFVAGFYGYLFHRRLQTTGLNGSFEVSAVGLVFRTTLRAVHMLPLDAVKTAHVRTFRRQRLLVIEGHDDAAAVYLPDIYDVPVETLAALITRRLSERQTV